MELYREEEREEVNRGGQEDKREEWKGERQILPVTSSLGVLHHLEHTEIQELGREEIGEKRDRGHLVEKKESPKEKRVVKPVISLSGKLGSEVWVLNAQNWQQKPKSKD